MGVDVEALKRAAEGATTTRVAIAEAPGYSVTAMGVVWSEDSDWRGYGCRPLTPVVDDGYRRVRLTVGAKRIKRSVHSLVAEAYIGPRPAGMQVCHIDGDPLNNWVGNLRYGTAADNARDRGQHQTTAAGENNGFAKLSQAQVDEIRSTDGLSQRALADRFGVSQRTIGVILRREQWKGIASAPLTQHDRDAAYISAASPDVILALLSRLETAERQVARATDALTTPTSAEGEYRRGVEDAFAVVAEALR